LGKEYLDLKFPKSESGKRRNKCITVMTTPSFRITSINELVRQPRKKGADRGRWEWEMEFDSQLFTEFEFPSRKGAPAKTEVTNGSLGPDIKHNKPILEISP